MTITNTQSRTNVHQVAEGIYRINTPVELEGGGGFSFNQYLLVDDEPLLFHTGPRKMFPLVREAVASVLPVERLRHIAFSHVEADECGSLNEWLVVAPRSAPLCGTVAAMVSIGDLADRAPVRSRTESCPWGSTPCVGSTRRICHTRGSVGFWRKNEPLRCCAATCSRRGATIFRPSRSRIFLGRARLSVMRWITSRTQRTRASCLRSLCRRTRQHSRVCTVAHGVVTGQDCFVLWLMRYLNDLPTTRNRQVTQPGAPAKADTPRRCAWS